MNDFARAARRHLLELVHKNQAPHIGSSLSMIDFLTAIFQRNLERSSVNGFRDDLVLSKGHAAAGFYSVLRAFDLISQEDFDSFYADGSDFYGHISHKSTDWSALTTGSLGHGLPFAIGIAIANRQQGKLLQESIVIMSDGECDEGSIWESALIANHHKLNNLKVIVDRNLLQSLTFTESTLSLEPFAQKWTAFGWEVANIDGHSHNEVLAALNIRTNKPLCIIANTVKGKGVSFMENDIRWHYRSPDSAEYFSANEELRSR